MATGGAKDTDQQSDETFDLLCSVCKRKNRNTEATKFCVDCQDYYCCSCVTFHDDVPALSRHKILDRGQFQPGNSQVLQMVPTERCDRHSHKHVDMYCQNHDDVGCSTCIAVDHKLCQDTFYIPDYLQNHKDSSKTKLVYQELETTETFLQDQHNNIQKEKSSLQKCMDLCLEKIKKFREEINQRLDELEKISTEAAEAKYKQKLDKLDEKIDKIQETKVKISAAKDDLSTASNNESQVFVSTKKGKKVVDEALKSVTVTDDEVKGYTSNAQFVPERKLTLLLKELNHLGHFEDDNEKESETVTEDKSTQSIGEEPTIHATQVEPDVLIEVRQKQYKVNIKVPSDKNTCNIYSACVLDEETIILADQDNGKLKRFNCCTNIVRDYCEVHGHLYQVCKIDNREVAVSSWLNVQFVSVGSEMVPTRQIEINQRCDGLTYAAGHVYIADKETISIYTKSGSKLDQVNMDQAGNRIFSNIYSLAVSNDGSKIYVADRTLGLIALDRSGEVVGKFDGPELKNAEDVCVTDNGSVLICGYDSKNVLQFTPDCKKVGEILKHESGVQAICYSNGQSKLIVGVLKRNFLYLYR